MGDGTGIEWTDATWNPVRGCSRVSEGCRNCYAERFASRGLPGYEGLTKGGKWTGDVRLVPEALDRPLKWKAPRRIFVNSMSDLFHESLAFEDILRIFEVMEKAKQHTFQVLTKRPKRAFEFCRHYGLLVVGPNGETQSGSRFPDNVWMGASTENQATANERIPWLIMLPAPVIFVSCEPLLGDLNLRRIPLRPPPESENDPIIELDALTGHVNGPDDVWPAKISWVIAGGESGPGARPMHIAWARSLRDQCAAAEVPFFFKQWGEYAPILDADGERYQMKRPVGGKKSAGSLLDGVEHKAFPSEVRHG
jgi:protein gp37